MGNEASTANIDNGVLLPNASDIPLDNPDVDKRINLGTTAPNCQPKHTREAMKQEAARPPLQNSSSDSLDGEDLIDDENSSQVDAKVETGLEIVHDAGNGKNRVYLTNESSSSADASLMKEENTKRSKLKSSSSKSSICSEDDGDRSVDTVTERRKQQEYGSGAKMGYIQMAKLGYQELVNAIIRPPRADYKVRFFQKVFICF